MYEQLTLNVRSALLRSVSLRFAFPDQSLPGSGTFDLSVGPSKVLIINQSFSISIFFYFLQGFTSWHHGTNFGQQINSLLDFGKAEMENSGLPSYIKQKNTLSTKIPRKIAFFERYKNKRFLFLFFSQQLFCVG